MWPGMSQRPLQLRGPSPGQWNVSGMAPPSPLLEEPALDHLVPKTRLILGLV